MLYIQFNITISSQNNYKGRMNKLKKKKCKLKIIKKKNVDIKNIKIAIFCYFVVFLFTYPSSD